MDFPVVVLMLGKMHSQLLPELRLMRVLQVLQEHLAFAFQHVALMVLVVHQHVHALVLVERHPMKAAEHLRQVVEC
jgi:hypothetical protein